MASQFLAERIVKKRMNNANEPEYYVKWLGYRFVRRLLFCGLFVFCTRSNTWEPLAHLLPECKEMVDEVDAEYEAMRIKKA
jgi:hypothetical protein